MTARGPYWSGSPSCPAGSWSLGVSAGASGGVNYGCWLAENHRLSGDNHGFSFDILEIAQFAGRMAGRNSFEPAATLEGRVE